jgi:formate dehydrogenase
MPVELQRTFCRICEAHCGLVAEVERKSQHVLRLILADLPRLEAREAELSSSPGGRLRLIGLRERRTHNSWLHNLERPDLAGGNRALMNPADASSRAIGEGALIFVRGAGGELRLPVQLSDDILEGVIAVPHGWDHTRAQTTRASALPGQNFNRAIPSGGPHLEPPSGQAIMLGHAVEVGLADGCDATDSHATR